ncbi:hypothetical protein [Vibrio vulnificus]|uniref:hypothetical protein n=1 Tax=Vibrio vulnificus TaxID=672 RepID=UPI001A1C82AF|nr:hypothetical protein [Vibrio vulnificus]MCA0770344.1 hypothetical protein [Vibrio vulnificus]HAS6242243.1 hypothetical protein [Vibrio vulnificus]HDY7944371.1 hypothetical protein [Vibrio vulnificus]
MPITRRSTPQQSLTMKQVAKLILVIYDNSPDYQDACRSQGDPKFKLQETVIQQIVGMPLSDQNRKHIVRELNILGWEVAINSRYWLIFSVRDLHDWHDAGTLVKHSLLETLLSNPEPHPLGQTCGMDVTPNEVAKFNGYSETDIIDELAQNRYHRFSDEQIDEFEATGDASILGIEDDEQLPIDTFSFWQYVDFYLAKKALNRFAPLIR